MIEKWLELSRSVDGCEITINGIAISPDQARDMGRFLIHTAVETERAMQAKHMPTYPARSAVEQRTAAEAIPVDRSCRVLTDGSPVTPDHLEINPSTGMQKGYVVLCEEERKKGFVRPVRRAYKHLTCGTVTTMGIELAETYARDPKFYSGTMCIHCRTHFPLDQFVWAGTDEVLGT